MRRIRFMGAAAAAILLAAGLLAGCTASPAGSDGTPTATASPVVAATAADVCARAQALLAGVDADRALTLIDGFRAQALARMTAGSTDPSDAAAARACEPERAAALIAGSAASSPPDDPLGLLAAVDAWEKAQKGWLGAAVTLLTWTLAVSAGLIVLARLLVFVVPWTSLPARWRRSRPFQSPLSWWPLVVIVGGVATAAWCGAALAPSGALWPPGPLGLVGVLGLLGVLAALIGTWRTVHWFGARPRVAVSVTGADGTASAVRSAQVAALTAELGAAPPRSIETPGASDITQLTDATSTVSKNPFITFFTTVIDFVVNVSPWQVTITDLADGSSHVDIRWNGSAVEAATLSPASLSIGDNGPKDVAQRLQAAFITTTLVNTYADMTGLYGATRWRSVALAFVAVDPFDRAERKRLLTRAVVEDPRNALARRGRDNLRHSDPDTLEKTDAAMTALEWEANAVAPLSGDRPPFPRVSNWHRLKPRADQPSWSLAPRDLLARTLVMWAAALSNRIVLSNGVSPAFPGPGRIEADAQAIEVLVSTVAKLTEDAGGARTPFLAALRGRTAITVERLHDLPAYAAQLAPLRATTLPWYREATESRAPGVTYRLACRAAARGMPFDELLRAAFDDPSYVDWAPHDPDFAAYRDSHWELLHTGAVSDVWEVEPLATHRAKLSAMGVHTAAQLAKSGEGVRRALGLPPPTFTRLRRAARLAARLQSTTPERWRPRVPLIFSALMDADIDTLARLRATPLDELVEQLTDAVRGISDDLRPSVQAPPYVEPVAAVTLLRAHWLAP